MSEFRYAPDVTRVVPQSSFYLQHTQNNYSENIHNNSTHRAQTPPRTKCQPKVIRDSNLDFWINLDPDPDVCRIAPEMF